MEQDKVKCGYKFDAYKVVDQLTAQYYSHKTTILIHNKGGLFAKIGLMGY